MADKPSKVFRWDPPGSAQVDPPIGKQNVGFLTDDPIYAEWMNAKWANDYEWKEFLQTQIQTFQSVSEAVKKTEPGELCVVVPDSFPSWRIKWQPPENVLSVATDGRTVCAFVSTGTATQVVFFDAETNLVITRSGSLGPPHANARVVSNGAVFVVTNNKTVRFFDAETTAVIKTATLTVPAGNVTGCSGTATIISVDDYGANAKVFDNNGILVGDLEIAGGWQLAELYAVAADDTYLHGIYRDSEGSIFLASWTDLSDTPAMVSDIGLLSGHPEITRNSMVADGTTIYIGFNDTVPADLVKGFTIINTAAFHDAQKFSNQHYVETCSTKAFTHLGHHVTSLAADKDYVYATVLDFAKAGTLLIVLDKNLNFVRMFTVSSTNPYLTNLCTDGADIWLLSSMTLAGATKKLVRVKTDSTVTVWKRAAGDSETRRPFLNLLLPQS